MIYLDNNSTTQLDPAVIAIMIPLMEQLIGNPSSVHKFGQKAKGILIDALKQCAQFFNVREEEIIFTSGATEALNLILHSVSKHGHIISSSLEHAAIIEPLKYCGAQVTYLDPLFGHGAVTVQQVQEALQPNTEMIVLSAANNETGIKNDIQALAQFSEEVGIPLVVDGVAYLGKDLAPLPSGITAACFSGHKIHAPSGIGMAWIKKKLKTRPLILGGPQQRGLRAGTENLVAICGFIKALELLDPKWVLHMRDLRDQLEKGLSEALPDILIHGKSEPRICNTTNIAFLGVDGETLLMMLDLNGLAASHGSACSAGALEVSRVLRSMGIAPKIARSSLRFSLSRFTTEEEIHKSIELIATHVRRLREHQLDTQTT